MPRSHVSLPTVARSPLRPHHHRHLHRHGQTTPPPFLSLGVYYLHHLFPLTMNSWLETVTATALKVSLLQFVKPYSYPCRILRIVNLCLLPRRRHREGVHNVVQAHSLVPSPPGLDWNEGLFWCHDSGSQGLISTLGGWRRQTTL